MLGSEDIENVSLEPSVEMDSIACTERTSCDPGTPTSLDMPTATTRSRKKLNSNEEDADADFIPELSIPQKQKQKISIKKTVRKEYARPDSMRAPETTHKGKKLTLEDPSSKKAKKPEQKRPTKGVVHVVGSPMSMYEDLANASEEKEEEVAANAPPSKKKKLFADAMLSRSAPKTKPSPPKSKKSVPPKRTTRDIPVAETNKGSASRDIAAEEEEDTSVMRQLRAHLPLHNEAHPVAEDMKKRRDQGLRQWRTVVDPYFHTKEQQDFYETMLLCKSPVVSDMRYVDWEYIKEHEHFFHPVRENLRAIDIEDFVGKEITAWNDEMIMQFYSTAHFYPHGRIVWMAEGRKYECTVEEWDTIIGA